MAAVFATTLRGDYREFQAGWDWGGDAILYFSPVIGLGIGSGMINARSTSELTYSGLLGSGTMTLKPEVKVVPIRAGLHFAVPMGSLVNLTLYAGAEYHLAKIKYTKRSEYDSGGWSQEVTEVESKGKIGIVAGLGLEIRLHPNLSLLLEGRGRYAQIDGFSGNLSHTSSGGAPYVENGDLWYVKINVAPLGTFPFIVLSDTPPPSDPMFQDARSARLSLNGFAALGGIMIRL
ncbi:MAG: hypothetical protein FJY83_04160 [Candidatus Aminicenantes bacterium]|nr:hypothetical protein [Candidatus Aminicenantes bacterium]